MACRVRYHAVAGDTVPSGIPFRAGYHAVGDTMLWGIPCHLRVPMSALALEWPCLRWPHDAPRPNGLRATIIRTLNHNCPYPHTIIRTLNHNYPYPEPRLSVPLTTIVRTLNHTRRSCVRYLRTLMLRGTNAPPKASTDCGRKFRAWRGTRSTRQHRACARVSPDGRRARSECPYAVAFPNQRRGRPKTRP